MKNLSVFIFLLLSFLYVAGQKNPEKENDARNSMFNAEQYFTKDSLNLALNGDGKNSGFLDIIQKHEGTQTAILAHYYTGMCLLRNGKFQEAISHLKQFNINDQIVACFALGGIADAYLELGDLTKATDYYLLAAKRNVNSFSTPYFLNRAAFVYEMLGNSFEAFNLYEQIRVDFSQSYESREVEKYMAGLNKLVAENHAITDTTCLVTSHMLNENIIGSVNGKEITLEDFEKRSAEYLNIYKQWADPGQTEPDMLLTCKNASWDEMVRNIILTKEYETLGLDIGTKEMDDLFFGENPHPIIVQNFSDPQTQKYDPQVLKTFIENLDQAEQKNPGTKKEWLTLKKAVKDDQLWNKYTSLITGAYYKPSTMLKSENKKVSFRFITQAYSSIKDSEVTMTTDDLNEYYNAHKFMFHQEESRTIDFVVFSENPVENVIKDRQETIRAIASSFAKQFNTALLFDKAVTPKNGQKYNGKTINKMDKSLPDFSTSREVIRWAFNTSTKAGDVSDVFEANGKFVVACIKEIHSKGISTLDDCKSYIEPIVKKEKKSEIISEKIQHMITPGITLEQLAVKGNFIVNKAIDISFSSFSLAGLGPEPSVIGTAFSLKDGELSVPIAGNSGVFVVVADTTNELVSQTEFDKNRTLSSTYFQSRTKYELYINLLKNATIIDNRLKFY
jgi:tetratricopeptide (TPR) repeat protein